MPRSTGGGSHSSGGHSSSHSSHSAHSTGGGSHSGGYSSSRSSCTSSGSYGPSKGYNSHGSFNSSTSPRPQRSRARVSSQSFAGAPRSKYYPDNTQPVLGSYDETVTIEKHNGRLIFYLFSVLLLIVAFWDLFTPPTALNNQANRNIVIRDELGVIEDRAALEKSLEAFLDKTGIAPSVMTVTKESWNRYYRNLEARAFDLYMNEFQDEQHWLIVYSAPSVHDPGCVDWRWEGIAGDETDDILTNEVVDFFGQRLQKYLTNQSLGVDEAFCRAFDETTAMIMSAKYDKNDLPVAVITVLALLALGLWRSGYFPRRRKQSMEPAKYPVADEAENLPQETTEMPASAPTAAFICPYCGSMLLEGMLKCPSCGAARKQQL